MTSTIATRSHYTSGPLTQPSLVCQACKASVAKCQGNRGMSISAFCDNLYRTDCLLCQTFRQLDYTADRARRGWVGKCLEEARGCCLFFRIPCNYGKLWLLVIMNAHHWLLQCFCCYYLSTDKKKCIKNTNPKLSIYVCIPYWIQENTKYPC